jgi:hypothetical protein
MILEVYHSFRCRTKVIKRTGLILVSLVSPFIYSYLSHSVIPLTTSKVLEAQDLASLSSSSEHGCLNIHQLLQTYASLTEMCLVVDSQDLGKMGRNLSRGSVRCKWLYMRHAVVRNLLHRLSDACISAVTSSLVVWVSRGERGVMDMTSYGGILWLSVQLEIRDIV